MIFYNIFFLFLYIPSTFPPVSSSTIKSRYLRLFLRRPKTTVYTRGVNLITMNAPVFVDSYTYLPPQLIPLVKGRQLRARVCLISRSFCFAHKSSSRGQHLVLLLLLLLVSPLSSGDPAGPLNAI